MTNGDEGQTLRTSFGWFEPCSIQSGNPRFNKHWTRRSSCSRAGHILASSYILRVPRATRVNTIATYTGPNDASVPPSVRCMQLQVLRSTVTRTEHGGPSGAGPAARCADRGPESREYAH